MFFSFIKELAGYTWYASQFSQKNLNFFACTFIEIAKLFEIFLKTHPSKLFKNYGYIYIHIQIELKEKYPQRRLMSKQKQAKFKTK